jgi:hypothetical protein
MRRVTPDCSRLPIIVAEDRNPSVAHDVFDRKRPARHVADYGRELTKEDSGEGMVARRPPSRASCLTRSTSMFYDEVDDVIAAANYLAQRPDVDASHIFVGVIVLQKAAIEFTQVFWSGKDAFSLPVSV